MTAHPPPPPPPDHPFDVDAYIGDQTWVFARTMAHIPHEYVTLKASTDRDRHHRFLAMLREVGEPRTWGRGHDTFWYMTIGGYVYWAGPVRDRNGDEWTIINRKHPDAP